jgi:hypothetical protein
VQLTYRSWPWAQATRAGSVAMMGSIISVVLFNAVDESFLVSNSSRAKENMLKLSEAAEEDRENGTSKRTTSGRRKHT